MFREMLRIKRSVQAQFNTESSYLAAQVVVASHGAAKDAEEERRSGVQTRFRYSTRKISGVVGVLCPPLLGSFPLFSVPSVLIGD
jgi:hypothetical protein